MDSTLWPHFVESNHSVNVTSSFSTIYKVVASQTQPKPYVSVCIILLCGIRNNLFKLKLPWLNCHHPTSGLQADRVINWSITHRYTHSLRWELIWLQIDNSIDPFPVIQFYVLAWLLITENEPICHFVVYNLTACPDRNNTPYLIIMTGLLNRSARLLLCESPKR